MVLEPRRDETGYCVLTLVRLPRTSICYVSLGRLQARASGLHSCSPPFLQEAENSRPEALPNLVNFMVTVYARVEPCQEASDILSFESSITAGGDTVRRYSAAVAPPPQGVRMHMKKTGHFPHGQHVIHLLLICHIFSHLLFS